MPNSKKFLTPRDTLQLLADMINNGSDINADGETITSASSAFLLQTLEISQRQVSELEEQVKAKDHEILRLKVTRNVRKITGVNLDELGDAMIELQRLVDANEIEAYDSTKYRAGFSGGKGACERYIKQVIEPAFEKVGLAHLAYEPRIYKDIMPVFHNSYRTSAPQPIVA